MQMRTSALALAIAAAAPSIAGAVDFSYNGFSTASYSQTDTDLAQVGFAGEPNAIDSDGSFKADSKLGVQVSAKLSDVFSVTAQGVAYSDLTSTWEPRLDWAYVRAQVTPALSARAGYLRTPTFMFSDSVFIGYANVWLRAPLEIYNQSPAFQLRGVDLNWRGTIGPVNVSLQPYFGDSHVPIGEGATQQTLHAKNWVGLVAAMDYGSFTLRSNYSRLELDSEILALQPLVDALNAIPAAFCASCAAVADGLQFKGNEYDQLTVGAQYDDGVNLAIGEYASRRDSRRIITPDVHGAYVTYGRRFGGLMPYATYAIHRVDSATSTDDIPAFGPLAALAAGVNDAMGGTSDQDTYSFGIRYELPSFSVVKGALMKLQYDRIETDGGPGNLNHVLPGFDGTVDMIGMSFDFIF